jgi:hypothetical protein
MTDRTKRVGKFLSAVIASLVLAVLGAYVLREFRTSWGLGAGLLCEFFALAIAFPTQFHDGALALKENLVILVPVIVGAIAGGRRNTDPPADPPPADPPAEPKDGAS